MGSQAPLSFARCRAVSYAVRSSAVFAALPPPLSQIQRLFDQLQPRNEGYGSRAWVTRVMSFSNCSPVRRAKTGTPRRAAATPRSAAHLSEPPAADAPPLLRR